MEQAQFNKDVVLGIRQRGGPLKLIQVPDNKAGTLYAHVAQHRFEQTVSRMAGVAPMPYHKLIEQNAFTPFVRP